MAVKLIHKNSGVKNKPVREDQIDYGEISINWHESGPFVQVKDSQNEIVRVGGVIIQTNQPALAQKGAFWFSNDPATNDGCTLYIYNGSAWIPVCGDGVPSDGGSDFIACTDGGLEYDQANDCWRIDEAWLLQWAQDNSPGTVEPGDGQLIIQDSDGDTLGVFTANQATGTTTTITIPAGFSGDYNDLTNKPDIGDGTLTLTDANDNSLGTFTANQQGDTSIKLPAGFSGDYNDLTNKPDIGDGTLTLKDANDATLGTFTANQQGNTEVTLPAGFSGDYNDLNNKPDINDGTLTVKNSDGSTHATFTANQAGPSEVTLPETFSGDYEDLVNKPIIGDGELHIKDSDGDTVAKFTANQQGNTEFNLPAVNDGKLTIKDSDGNNLGDFTANQPNDTEIILPAGGGGGGPVDWNDIENKPDCLECPDCFTFRVTRTEIEIIDAVANDSFVTFYTTNTPELREALEPYKVATGQWDAVPIHGVLYDCSGRWLTGITEICGLNGPFEIFFKFEDNRFDSYQNILEEEGIERVPPFKIGDEYECGIPIVRGEDCSIDGGGGFEEPPDDGKAYVRKNGEWVVIELPERYLVFEFKKDYEYVPNEASVVDGKVYAVVMSNWGYVMFSPNDYDEIIDNAYPDDVASGLYGLGSDVLALKEGTRFYFNGIDFGVSSVEHYTAYGRDTWKIRYNLDERQPEDWRTTVTFGINGHPRGTLTEYYSYDPLHKHEEFNDIQTINYSAGEGVILTENNQFTVDNDWLRQKILEVLAE